MKLPDKIYAYTTESRGHSVLWKFSEQPIDGAVRYDKAGVSFVDDTAREIQELCSRWEAYRQSGDVQSVELGMGQAEALLKVALKMDVTIAPPPPGGDDAGA